MVIMYVESSLSHWVKIKEQNDSEKNLFENLM